MALSDEMKMTLTHRKQSEDYKEKPKWNKWRSKLFSPPENYTHYCKISFYSYYNQSWWTVYPTSLWSMQNPERLNMIPTSSSFPTTNWWSLHLSLISIYPLQYIPMALGFVQTLLIPHLIFIAPVLFSLPQYKSLIATRGMFQSMDVTTWL